MHEVDQHQRDPKDPSLRILIDIGRLGRGGAERQTVQMVTGLSSRGHHCILIVNQVIEAYSHELQAGGVQAVEIGGSNPYDPRVIARLTALTRRFRPDVCLSVSFSATLWGRLAAVITRTPAVIAEHSSIERRAAKVRLTNRMLAPFTTATVACAREQVPSLVAAGNRRDRIVIVRNGVDGGDYYPEPRAGRALRRSLGIPGDAIVIGLVAGHRRKKRHELFIRVMEPLVAANDRVWGLMVGGGELLESNRAAAQRSPAGRRLVVAGPQTNMRAVYSAIDIATLVSDEETFPMCFLEAQSCGCPVVGMDASGVRSTFARGRSGLLVAQGDLDGMVDALSQLVADEDRRVAMGQYGRRWVGANLSLEHMIDEYEQVLTNAAARKRHHGLLACGPAGGRHV